MAYSGRVYVFIIVNGMGFHNWQAYLGSATHTVCVSIIKPPHGKLISIIECKEDMGAWVGWGGAFVG